MRLLMQERTLRLKAEKQRDEIECQLINYQQQMKDIHDTLVCHLIFFYGFINIHKYLIF